VPDHRRRNRRSPKHRVVEALYDVVSEQLQDLKGHLWVRRWLFPNAENKNSLIPRQAGTTITQGLARLFEMPYQAICRVANEGLKDADLCPYVCPNDAGPTKIVVIDIKSSRVVGVFEHKAWEFRFANLKELDAWMTQRVREIQSIWRARK
jgi:hypothetical protein